ncbi:MAG: PEP-CTERM sorting domain-containing protein [Planctomycetota bacterium]
MTKKTVITTVALTAAAAAFNADAAIFAGFEDMAPTAGGGFLQVTPANLVATDADQYSGIMGDGWLNGWELENPGGSFRTYRVADFNSLQGGAGNHLDIAYFADTGNPRIANTRQYGNSGDFQLDQAGTFEFLFRVNDASTFAAGGFTFITFNDGGGLFANGSTWQITTTSGTTKRWLINGGGSNEDSFLNIVEGTTYKFTINSDPVTQTFNVAIDADNDGMVDFQSADLAFLQDVDEHGGKLSFITQFGTGEVQSGLSYSLDSVSIQAAEVIPEPASIGLISFGCLLAITRRRKSQ